MAEAKTESKPKLPAYTVAKGVKSLSTRKGIVCEGAEVTAEMLTGGKATLDALVKKKLVSKN